MKKSSILFLCSILISLTACKEDYPELNDGLYAEVVTNKGTFVAELFYEATPITVASFVSLAEGNSEMVEDEYKDKKFYDGLKFHRVIEDFMIQGGDPLGTGTGGPGYKFPNEIVDSLQHDSKGILSMANSGPDTNGSQFFITLKETPWLNGMHTVFGEVVEGLEVVDSIGAVETGDKDIPVEEIVMQEVNIIRKGSEAKDFKASEIFNQGLQNMEAKAEEEQRKMEELKETNIQKFEEMEADAEEFTSGLKIYYNEKGDGEEPTLGDVVLINYKGFLKDGLLFDTNVEELAREAGTYDQRRKDQGGYEPMPMPYSPEANMIPGFKEGVQKMKVGDKATLFIPSHLGYGERGAGGVIPPNADLVFEVEMVDIQE